MRLTLRRMIGKTSAKVIDMPVIMVSTASSAVAIQKIFPYARIVQIGWNLGYVRDTPTKKEYVIKPEGFCVSDKATRFQWDVIT